LERDLIRFPDEEIGGAPLAELIRQLVGFGKERYDDLADAFSVAGLGVIDADERGPRIGWIDNYNGSYSETKLFADEYSNGKLRWGVPFNPFEQINQ
jgi:hypothetical protein